MNYEPGDLRDTVITNLHAWSLEFRQSLSRVPRVQVRLVFLPL